jgi:hypothetical protein
LGDNTWRKAILTTGLVVLAGFVGNLVTQSRMTLQSWAILVIIAAACVAGHKIANRGTAGAAEEEPTAPLMLPPTARQIQPGRAPDSAPPLRQRSTFQQEQRWRSRRIESGSTLVAVVEVCWFFLLPPAMLIWGYFSVTGFWGDGEFAGAIFMGALVLAFAIAWIIHVAVTFSSKLDHYRARRRRRF